MNLLGNPKMPLFLVEERSIDINSIVMEMLYLLLLKILYAGKIFFSHSSVLKHWGSSQAKTLLGVCQEVFEWMSTHSASVILCGWPYCCEDFQSENCNLSTGAVQHLTQIFQDSGVFLPLIFLSFFLLPSSPCP